MGTPEGEFKRRIRKRLEEDGIFQINVGEGAFSTPGIPDIIIVINGLFVGLEVKTYKGSQSPVQKQFQRKTESAGGLYYIIRSMADLECAIKDAREITQRV